MIYDIVVVGGGIVGAGAARDATMRGLRVALVEQADFAYGTSSRSSKLVHGGLRYLERGELGLVFEAVSERRVLLGIAPHLVTPLGFLFPIYAGSRHSAFMLNVGMWLYDGLSLFRSPKLHRNLSATQAFEEEPELLRDGLQGAPLYYDCRTDDARLTIENALDAAARGATVHTWTRVESLLRDPSGRVSGVVARDALRGEAREIHARVVLNCTGPWAEGVRGKAMLRRTKGVHVVVDTSRLRVKNAVVCLHPRDGRVLFVIPWDDRTYIGTTDTDWDGDPAFVAADSADVDYLLEAANRYFDHAKLTRDDVIATWAGLRPLIAEEGAGTTSAVSREHAVVVDADGLITIAGGKLTTYRRMARELVDRALVSLRASEAPLGPLTASSTDREPLPGGRAWPGSLAEVERSILAVGSVDDATAAMFASVYGTRGVTLAERVAAEPALGQALVPGRPERLVQVDWAVDEELAQRVSDVMIRRTQLFFRDRDQGLGALARVADRMALRLGWSAERREAEVADYAAEVALSRAWRG